MSWYKCDVITDVITEDGEKTPSKESYLVEAYTVPEAAARITEHLNHASLTIEGITRMRLQEVFLSALPTALESLPGYTSSEGPFFLGKATLITIDNERDTERRQTFRYLVEADTLKGALERLEEEFRGSLSDVEILSLAQSPIVEVLTQPKTLPSAAGE